MKESDETMMKYESMVVIEVLMPDMRDADM